MTEMFVITIAVKHENEVHLRDACQRNGVYVEENYGADYEPTEQAFDLRSENVTSLFMAGVEYGRLTNLKAA